MPRPSFQALTRQLIDAGIAPRFAERLRRELEDHYRDLEREALDRERCPYAAALEARRRLGAEETIAREFLSRPELRSWVYRSWWVVSCLRVLCLCYVGLRGIWRAVAACRSGFLRFAAAGAAGVALTASLLLALEASLNVEPPNVVRTVGTVETMAAGGEVAETSASASAPEREDPPAEIRRPGFERPSVPVPDLPEANVGVEPMFAAVDVEMTLEMPMRLADGELLPIVKVVPQFPALAARRGLEGYVLIEYTVTRTGSVSDVVVVESSSEVFEQPALDAVSKFKYKPRIVDGMAVPVRGVRARMRFVLEA